MADMTSLNEGYRALIIGASGGIGAALVTDLLGDPRCGSVISLSRRDDPGFDLLDEASVEAAALRLKQAYGEFELIFDATGALEIDGKGPEKTIRAIDPTAMAAQFAVNAIGPALLIKHFCPLLSKNRRSLFVTLSARVGSIGDNRLGGWISYRAAKAALNQIVRTAALEVSRSHPKSLLVALHPGTVETRLGAEYGKEAATVFTPMQSVVKMLAALNGLQDADTGGFFAYDGSTIEW